jgi:glutamate formiminotransferase
MWLDDGDLDDARAIAAAVREGGRNGGLPGVRALGLACASTGRVQVSMNIEDYRRTPLGDVVARVRSEAARRGRIIGPSELVGLVPRDALTGTTPALLGLPRFDPAQIIPED